MKPDEIEQLLGIYDIRCEAYWGALKRMDVEQNHMQTSRLMDDLWWSLYGR